MSIRNIINDQFKHWLNGNINESNAKTIKFFANDQIDIQGATGADGQYISKSSGDLEWQNKTIYGTEMEFGDYVTSPANFTTVSTGWILVTGGTHTTADLPAGTYFVGYSAGLKPNNGMNAKIENLTTGSTIYNVFEAPGNNSASTCFSGYKIVALTGVNQLDFYITSIGGGVALIQDIRYYIYRII